MSSDFNICSLDCISKFYADEFGGKCNGLKQLESLLNVYRSRYNLNLDIPKTFAIPLSVHEEYKKEGKVPESLVKEAMSYVAALGGNVAVRSSADCEDSDTQSYSGKFKSVLHVKTRQQMRDALEKVYASAEAVPDARMGILIQEMIEQPQIAGVAYSETFFEEPWIVLNYTEGKPADKLITNGGDEGKLFAVCKYVKGACYTQRLSLSNMWNRDSEYGYLVYPDNKVHRADIDERLGKYKNQFILTALASGLEKHLGYPLDMEFAVSKNGKINILQQRPYLFPHFEHNHISENCFTDYNPQAPIATGTVEDKKCLTAVNNIVVQRDDYDKSSAIYTGKSYQDLLAFAGHNDNIFGGMCGKGINQFYTHQGNLSREGLDFSVVITREPVDAVLGDKMTVNFKNGQFTVYPRREGR